MLRCTLVRVVFFFFKQKTAYEIGVRLVGSEMCIRDRRWGVPLGVVVQDLYSRAMVEVGLLGDRSGGPATRLESFALKSADGLVAIHERFAQTMVDGLGVDRDRITVIPNWTHVQPPTGHRDATRRRLG